MSNIPFHPAFDPWAMPADALDSLLCNYGVRMTWQKSHTCPCIISNAAGGVGTPGQADPQCQTCFGLGTYWDAPSAPFVGLITFMHMSPSPDEPGITMDPKYGGVFHSEPTVTVPYSQASGVWLQATTGDLFAEIDAFARYHAVLEQGRTIWLPYIQSLNVAPSGAVTVYNPATKTVVPPPSGYTVSGSSVIVPGLVEGQGYAVEFVAAPMYAVFRAAGGQPHVRPFGAGEPWGQALLPRRFRAQTLDIWTRQRMANKPTSYYPQYNLIGRL